MSETSYKGIRLQQRDSPDAPELFVFSATAASILSWAEAHPTVSQPNAAQRMLSDPHLKRIHNFLSASPTNVIPTSVTIALPEGSYHVEGEFGGETIAELQISADSKPGIVIDGQHRLRALEEFQDEEISILATAILGADPIEQALQFVVINNSARRVPLDLVKAIVAEMDEAAEAQFRSRVHRVGLTLGRFPDALMILDQSDWSPFYGLLDWDANRTGQRILKPKALESALRVVISELATPADVEIDDALRFLCAIWSGIVKAWSSEDAWTSEQSKLSTNLGVIAATEFAVDRLNNKAEEGLDIEDESQIANQCHEIFSTIPDDFWLRTWSMGLSDTSVARRIVVGALAEVRRQAIREPDAPFDGIDLFETGTDSD